MLNVRGEAVEHGAGAGDPAQGVVEVVLAVAGRCLHGGRLADAVGERVVAPGGGVAALGARGRAPEQVVGVGGDLALGVGLGQQQALRATRTDTLCGNVIVHHARDAGLSGTHMTKEAQSRTMG